MTYAGKRGEIPLPWSGGYGTGYGGGEKGIEEIHLYDPDQGIATVFVAGQLFQVMNQGTILRVANLAVDLTRGTPLVVVGKDGFAHLGIGGEVKEVQAVLASGGADYFTAAPPKIQ